MFDRVINTVMSYYSNGDLVDTIEFLNQYFPILLIQ